MTRWVIKALGDESEVITIALEAASLDAARQKVTETGYHIVSATAESGFAVSNQPTVLPKRFSLLLFAQHLASMLDAGLTLVESLDALSDQETETQSAFVLRGILALLRDGHSFSVALEKSSGGFPPYFVAMIRASEQTGGVAESLHRFIQYQQQVDALRGRVRGALIYPTVLAVAGIVVCVFLMGYVIPRFSTIYIDRLNDVPWMSRLLLDWGIIVNKNATLAIALVVGGVGALFLLAQQAATRQKLVELIKKWPALGDRFRLYQLARFYRAMGLLLRGGMPMVRALDLAKGLLPKTLEQGVGRASEVIYGGSTVLAAFREGQLVTPVAERMLAVGQRAGNMGDMMERIANYYDDETARAFDMFVKLFEPIVMAAIGLLVGGIVVLMYIPIFELAGGLQ